MYKNLLKVGSMAIVAVAFVACSNYDNVYDGQAIVEQKKAEYAANFVKKYGEIDPNQSWDFSTMTPNSNVASSYSGVAAAPATRSMIDAVHNALASLVYPNYAPRLSGYCHQSLSNMTIEKRVIKWVADSMTAGHNNANRGRYFYMKVPDNVFSIVPVFQGCASYYWELCMHVDGYQDCVIWKKGEDLGYKKEGDRYYTYPGTSNKGVDTAAVEITAPVYTFSNLKKNAEMYFYLKVYPNGKNSTSNIMVLKSLDGYMLQVDGLAAPQAVPADNEVTMIGCEDNGTSGSDRDFEDLVFMMYGKTLPNFVRVDTILVDQTKRYMIEDLGGSDDFDFNDVVVDVAKFVKKRLTYSYTADGDMVLTGEEILPDVLDQQAVVRATGGTLDFTLQIGETVWHKSDCKERFGVEEMLNTGADGNEIDTDLVLDAFKVKGWNPDENNISIIVKDKQGNDISIEFPKRGEVPLIIAFDALPFQSWQKERVDIPKEWFEKK